MQRQPYNPAMRPGAQVQNSGPQYQQRQPQQARPQQAPIQVQVPPGMSIPPSFEDLQRINPQLAAQLHGAQYRGPDGTTHSYPSQQQMYNQPTQQQQQPMYQQMPQQQYPNPGMTYQQQQQPQQYMPSPQMYNQPSSFYGNANRPSYAQPPPNSYAQNFGASPQQQPLDALPEPVSASRTSYPF